MQGLAKQSRHIMYTEQQLCEFGNYLFRRYDVQVFSSDGKNQPIYQREVTDADFANWKHERPNANAWFPSQFNIGDQVAISLKGLSSKNDGSFAEVECRAKVLTVHFYAGKVKYDLEIDIAEEPPTRIYNIDSCFVKPLVPST